jgi:serine/threonine protein kinase
MHVVRVFGAVKDTLAGSRPRWLLVTEFCELGNLGELLNHREHGPKLTNPVLLRMMTEVAQGMNFLHGRNVLHLDIKPLNIFVRDN